MLSIIQIVISNETHTQNTTTQEYKIMSPQGLPLWCKHSGTDSPLNLHTCALGRSAEGNSGPPLQQFAPHPSVQLAVESKKKDILYHSLMACT